MPSRTLATLSIVAAGVLAPAAIADAAGKKASGYPTVKKIAPMSVSIGETMTITGSGYVKGKGKNTVVFRRTGKRAIFAKADGLSTTRLRVTVPEKLRSSLGKTNGAASPTKFQIRVLAKRFGKKYTTMKSSPTVLPAAPAPLVDPQAAPLPAPLPAAAAEAPAASAAPAPRNDPPPPPPNCDGDSQVDSVDSDDDNDLLSDTTETAIKTNRCDADTDGDGMEDGWEYQSAIDLNQRSCPKAPASTDVTHDYPKPCNAAMPYPGKKKYPNPLAQDGGNDYDGEGLPASYEFRAWQLKGQADKTYRALTGSKGMWYSAGKQASVDTASDVPDDNDCVGMALPNASLPFGGNYTRPEFEEGEGSSQYPMLDDGGSPRTVLPAYMAYTLARYDGDECLEDDERDEDGDYLSNFEELTGPMSNPTWWAGVYQEPLYTEEYEGTDPLDRDSDGDGTVDGLDDEDYDDFLNIEELRRGPAAWTDKTAVPLSRRGLWVNPFNPCLPNPESRTCKKHLPVGNPAAFAPFSKDTESANKNRWALYANPLYGFGGPGFANPLLYPVTYPDPTWVDNPADPDDKPAQLPVPAEIWTPDPLFMPGGYDTTGEPPVHPLPRPDLRWTP